MLDDDFRSRQVLADLFRIPGAWERARVGPAILNIRDEAGLCAAFGSLVAASLSSGRMDPLIGDLWTARSDRFRRAPGPFRAALMNGIKTLRDLGLAGDIDCPSLADRVTIPLQPIAAALIRIARRMTAEEMEHVSRADYGRDMARHRAAPDLLLDDPVVAYPPGEYWFPAEVVELVSHVPGKPGYVPCLAIVLLAALRNGDSQGHAEFRLARQWTAIAALDPAVRDAFFAAFRHLYESLDHWSPDVPEPFTLPWVSLS